MKLLLACLLPLTAFGAEPDLAKIPWPNSVRDFPRGEKVTFTAGGFEIRVGIPKDPEVRAGGGSGGPMVEFKLRDPNGRWTAGFTEQSVGERVLEPYRGKPQLEIWGRGGGGFWTRGLYRYLAGGYRCVRIDEFEEPPRHNNEHARTATLPNGRRGKGDQGGETLYFVETRMPGG